MIRKLYPKEICKLCEYCTTLNEEHHNVYHCSKIDKTFIFFQTLTYDFKINSKFNKCPKLNKHLVLERLEKI